MQSERDAELLARAFYVAELLRDHQWDRAASALSVGDRLPPATPEQRCHLAASLSRRGMALDPAGGGVWVVGAWVAGYDDETTTQVEAPAPMASLVGGR